MTKQLNKIRALHDELITLLGGLDKDDTASLSGYSNTLEVIKDVYPAYSELNKRYTRAINRVKRFKTYHGLD